METILLDIQTKLQAVEGLAYCGEDWGQLNFEQPPVSFPCALIDIGNITYSNTGKNVQLADAILNITVADVQNQGINPGMPIPLQANAFRVFKLLEEINKALHGKQGGNYGKLCRTQMRKTLREDLIREYVVSYRFNFTDSSAQPIMQKLSGVEPSISFGRIGQEQQV